MEFWRVFSLVLLSLSHLLFVTSEGIDEAQPPDESTFTSNDAGDIKALMVDKTEDKIEFCYDLLSKYASMAIPKQPVKKQAVLGSPQSLWWYSGDPTIFESYRRKLWHRRGLVWKKETTTGQKDHRDKSLEASKEQEVSSLVVEEQ